MGRSPGFPIPNGFQLCIFRLYIHFPFVEFKHKSICRYCIYVFSVEKITDFFCDRQTLWPFRTPK